MVDFSKLRFSLYLASINLPSNALSNKSKKNSYQLFPRLKTGFKNYQLLSLAYGLHMKNALIALSYQQRHPYYP